MVGDHALLDPDNVGCTGWFARNEWFRLLYYAVAPGEHCRRRSLPTVGCTTDSNCLSAPDLAGHHAGLGTSARC